MKDFNVRNLVNACSSCSPNLHIRFLHVKFGETISVGAYQHISEVSDYLLLSEVLFFRIRDDEHMEVYV